MSRYYVECETCSESLCVDTDEHAEHVCARITAAIHAERQRIATALRAVADRFGSPVKAALEQVAREVE